MTGVRPKMPKPAAASALSTSGDHASKRALGRDILRAVSFTKHSGAIEMRQAQHGVVKRVAPLIKWRVAVGRVVVRLRAHTQPRFRGAV